MKKLVVIVLIALGFLITSTPISAIPVPTNASPNVSQTTYLTVPLFSQKNPAWSGNLMGSSSNTIGSSGCLVTCLAMLLKDYGVVTDPGALNTWLSANSGYLADGSLASYTKPADYSSGKMQLVSYGGSANSVDNWSVLDGELAKGYPVIVQVDVTPGTATFDQHWVVVTGKQGSSYSINDPLDYPGLPDSSPNNLLSDYKNSITGTTFRQWVVYHPSTDVSPGSSSWLTFLGGSGEDEGDDIAIDVNGNSYVTGPSSTTWGSPVQDFTQNNGGSPFVAKLDNSGHMIWNTFLSGWIANIVVDASGNIYVCGASPLTWGSPIGPHAEDYGAGDAFVAKINPHGYLIWNTFLGGIGVDEAIGIKVDASNNIYVTGDSNNSWGSPIQPITYGSVNAFVAKLDDQGNLLWNTFMEGESYGRDIAVNDVGKIFVAGFSFSNWGSPMRPFIPGKDAFVAKFDTNGTMTWNTFLGGGNDEASGIALDAYGSVYVGGGSSFSWGSPINAFVYPSLGGYPTNAFAAKLDTSGNLIWNTFMGSGYDGASGIQVDNNGDVYLLGSSISTWGSPVRAYSGNRDTFIAKLNNSGVLKWNTFIGGYADDFSTNGIVVDNRGGINVSGYSYASWGSPIRPYTSGIDAFFAKLNSNGTMDPPSWRKDLQVGDLLFDPTANGGLGHIAIYAGNNQTIEAEVPFVTLDSLANWDSKPGAYIIRVNCTDAQRAYAVAFARSQIGKLYNPNWTQKSDSITKLSWYCSELVWAAYETEGINLEYTPDLFAVSPIEIFLTAYYNSQGLASIVPGSHFGIDAKIPQVNIPFNPIANEILNTALVVFALSPVDIQVTDPDGHTISGVSSNINDAIFCQDDIDGSSNPHSWVDIGSKNQGTYQVGVSPNSSAQPGSTFTLGSSVEGQTTILADNLLVSLIPTGGYSVVVTTTTLTSSANPSVYGQPVTFTASVSPIPEDGTIQFQDNGINVIGPIAVNSSGHATFTTPALLAGTHTITAVYSGYDNLADSTGAITQTITKASTTPVVTASSKAYDGTTASTIQTRTLTGAVAGDDVTLTGGTATFSDANVGNAKVVNATGLALSGTAAGNYTLSATTATTTANITAKALTVTGLAGVTKVYDGTTAATTTGTAALSGVISPDVVTLGGTPVFTFGSKNVSPAAAITTTGYTLGGAGSGNYTLAQPALTAAITAKPLTVGGSFTASNKTYDGTLSAAINTNSLSLIGKVSGDTVNLSAAAAFASAGVGTGKTVNLTATSSPIGADASNYTLSIAGAPATTADITKASVTPVVTSANKAYDGTTAATIQTRTLTGAVSGDDVTLTGGTAVFADANVGNAKVVNATGLTLSGTSAGNYTLSATTASTSANITAKALTVTGLTGVTKVYDGTTAAATTGTAALSGVISPDVVTLGGTPVFTFGGKNVSASSAITTTGYTLGGAGAGNYSLTQPALSAAITAKPLTVGGSFTASNKTYDGTTAATIATSSLTLTGVVAPGVVNIMAGSTAVFADANMGTGKTVSLATSTLGGADAGNYTLTLAGAPTTTANIITKSVTPGVTASSKVYDGSTAATIVTHTLTGVIGTDNVTLTGGTAVFADANVGNAKVVNATGLALSGTAAGNYTLFATTASTTANITAKALTVTGLTGVTKVYDGTITAATTGTAALSGVISPDVVTLGGTPVFTFGSKSVSTSSAITTTGYTLGGAGAGNYTLTQPALTAAITAKPLTVGGSFTASNKTYDGTTTATIATSSLTLTGVINPDAVNIAAGASAAFADASAATGKTVSLATSTLGGADAGNYTLTLAGAPTTTANVTPTALIITANDTSKTYGAAITFAGTEFTASGLLGGNTVTGVTMTGTGAAATSVVGSYPITPGNATGTGLSNYSISYANGSLTVNKKALTATADNKTITTGDPDPAFTITYTGFANGDTVSAITAPTAAVSGAHATAGTYTIAVSGGTATNYSFTYVNGTLTVNAATGGGGGGGGGGGFGNQLVGINLSGTSPWMDGNGKSITAGQISTPDGKLTLCIPSGVFIWNAAGAAQPFVSANTVDTTPAAPTQQKMIRAFDLGPNGVTLTPGISLVFNYTAADLSGGYSESSLYIAWWDGSAWVKLTSTIDTAAKTVTAMTTHFTTFGLLAQAAPPTTTPPPTTTLPPPTTTPPLTTIPPTTTASSQPPLTSTSITTLPSSNASTSDNSSGNNLILPFGLFVGISVILGSVMYLKRRRPS